MLTIPYSVLQRVLSALQQPVANREKVTALHMPIPPTYVQYESSLGGYQDAHLFSCEVSLHLC